LEAFQCQHCDEQFKIKKLLEIHLQGKHKDLKEWQGLEFQKYGHKCDKCRKYFISSFVLENHLTYQHRKKKNVAPMAAATFLIDELEEEEEVIVLDDEELVDPLAIDNYDQNQEMLLDLNVKDLSSLIETKEEVID